MSQLGTREHRDTQQLPARADDHARKVARIREFAQE
jgi:hypothetical protein